MSETKYYGKYRSTVVNNIDPEQRARIQATVPGTGTLVPTSWAMPCLPIAGRLEGFFAIPQIGAGVWIEFEGGDLDKPVWTGGFWSLAAEVPTMALAPPAIRPGQNIAIQTTGAGRQVITTTYVEPTLENTVGFLTPRLRSAPWL